MSSAPAVSVVIPTYRRSAMLRNAVRSVLCQNTGSSFEIVVVDNNSPDDTRSVVHALSEEHPGMLRYVFEPRQGNAYARNTGVEAARAPIIAFADDDVTVDTDWLDLLSGVLDARPDLSFVGGKVLPQWTDAAPAWLTPTHWAPLALLDYGPEEMPIGGTTPRSLLTANIAFRRSVFDDVGLFSPQVQRVKDFAGSLEDHEFLLRVCRSGRHGLYFPGMVVTTQVAAERLTKDYHRRWHTGHGHFYSVLRDPEWERSRFRLLGVPAHLYRETARHAVSWFTRTVQGHSDAAFVHECRVCFFRGFLRHRMSQVMPGRS